MRCYDLRNVLSKGDFKNISSADLIAELLNLRHTTCDNKVPIRIMFTVQDNTSWYRMYIF